MVSDLPTGVVTLLFTDIEGSTRLLHELGDDYGEALNEHRRRLRATFAEHEGVEVDRRAMRFSSHSPARRTRSPLLRTASAHLSAGRFACAWGCTRASLG